MSQLNSYIHVIKLNDMMVYLVYRDMGYNGITLLESKIFNSEVDAIAYKQKLEELNLYGLIKIKVSMLNN